MSEQEQIDELKRELTELKNIVYKNNFTNKQYFDKSLYFNFPIEVRDTSTFSSRATFPAGRLNITVGLPLTCSVGDLALNGGSLYACFTTNNWTLIGPYVAP